MGEKEMTSHITIDKNTNVAFIDVSEAAENAEIQVTGVSDMLGLRSQIRARYNAKDGTLLGLIIEDYPAFRREIMLKYVAFRVSRIVDLLICSVKASLSQSNTQRHRLAAV
jgi:hypothetical protein